MKIAKLISVSCSLLAVGCLLLEAHIARSEEGEPVLPGAEVKLEKIVEDPDLDLIALAKLVKIGQFYPPRMPGYREFDTTFDIIKVIKGKSAATVTMSMYVDGRRPEVTGGVKEGVKYIIFCFTSPDGNRGIGKMLLDNEKTEMEVAAAVATAH